MVWHGAVVFFAPRLLPTLGFSELRASCGEENVTSDFELDRVRVCRW